MTRHLLLFAVAAAVSACAKDGPTNVPPPIFDIYTPGEVFSPTPLEIPLGAIVRFNMNGQDGHDATFANVPGAPADIPVVNNVVVSRTFTARGTFPYDCFVHPGMAGVIVVQ